MHLEKVPAEIRSTFINLATQLRQALAEVRERRNATGREHHKAIDKAVREAVEEALKPVDPEEGTTAIEQAGTPAAVAKELHKAVEENAIIDDNGNVDNGNAPIVHDAVDPAPGPVNAEVPKIPMTAEKVMEGVHPGTEAAESPIAAQDQSAQHVVDKATLTSDNGLAQSTTTDGDPVPKQERIDLTKKAAVDAGNPRETH